MHGYHNRVAWIDLSQGNIETKPLDRDDVRAFMGGANLGAAILARLTDGETDAYDPENPVIFMTGPLAGTGLPFASRHEVISLSPLTGIYAESNTGGSMAWQLKLSGFDGLVITGQAAEPTVIVIDGQEISLRPSADLWGQTVYDADKILKDEIDPKAVTALIGPAGENLVKFASISHNGRATRAAGRCGMGAVLGSKQLKGLMVTSSGKLKPSVADPEGLKAAIKKAMKTTRERLDLFGQIGTPGGVINYEKLGNLPINNWRDGANQEVAEKTTGTVMKDTIWVKRNGCKGCVVQCGREVEVKEGPFATEGVVEGPEYETLAAFGSLCLNDNLEAIAKANELCNNLGLDTISCGMTVAFAMECVEKGVIGPDLLDGLDLGFGQAEAMVELVRKIAYREGELADILANGTREASIILGNGAEEYAIQVKGLEFPMHDPRFSWGHAISYSTGNRGACHLTSLSHPYELAVGLPELGYDGPFPGRQQEGKVQWTIHLQHLMNVLDSLCLCKFSMLNNCLTISDFVEFYALVTGIELSVEEFMAVGERGFTLKRMINNRRGITRKDDILPPRFRTLKKTGRDYQFDIPPLLPMLSEYYDIRGWTEEGRPGPETVNRLELADFD